MIESGRQPVDSPERVIEFMNLTYRFWSQKAMYLRLQAETENNKLIIEELDKYSNKIKLLFTED